MVKYIATGGVLALLLLGGFMYSRINTGTTSAQSLTPQKSFTHSHGIAVDAIDPNKLYIATHEGLYLLENEKDLYRVGNTRDDLMGFTAHPFSAGIFFSSGHSARAGNIGFQKTQDGGMTWKKISNGLNGPVDFHAMTISQANPDVVFGSFRGLQRSLDGGMTWEYAKGEITPIALITHPDREEIVYAATKNGIQISEDKGDSWKSLAPELEGGAVSTLLLRPDGTILAYSEKLGGLGVSRDSGVTWTNIDENFGGDVILYLASSANATYALTNQNRLYKSVDLGETWSMIR